MQRLPLVAPCSSLPSGSTSSGLMPGRGLVAEPGLSGGRAGEGRNERRAGLGLPPGVDDRAAAVADDPPVPFPGLGIDRLADRADQAQRLAAVALHRLVAFAHQRADRGRCGVEDGDAEPVDRLPEAAEVRIIGDAVEHDGRRAIHQRAVDDVAVAGDPADVGGAPEDVVRPIVEDPVERRRGPDRIAAGGVDDALRLSGRSRRVEDEQRVLGVHHLRLAVGREAVAHARNSRRRGRPSSARRRRCGVTTITVCDVAMLERRVDVALQRDDLAAAHAFVGGDHRAGIAIGDAAGDAFRREAAEDDRMDGPDPGAGEHRRRRLGDHRHVDHHAVAALDPALLQQVREAAGLLVQLAIGDWSAIARLVGLEDDRRPVAMLCEVPVEAIDRQVELPVRIPADVEVVLVDTTSRRLRSALDTSRAASPGPARSR